MSTIFPLLSIPHSPAPVHIDFKLTLTTDQIAISLICYVFPGWTFIAFTFSFIFCRTSEWLCTKFNICKQSESIYEWTKQKEHQHVQHLSEIEAGFSERSKCKYIERSTRTFTFTFERTQKQANLITTLWKMNVKSSNGQKAIQIVCCYHCFALYACVSSYFRCLLSNMCCRCTTFYGTLRCRSRRKETATQEDREKMK